MPSFANFGEAKNKIGISVNSSQFSFVARSGFIILTEGRWEGFSENSRYSVTLIGALKSKKEWVVKKGFGIKQNGLCAILEKVEHRDGVRVYLHVRVIGEIPVVLKVMRHNEDRWESVPVNEESDNLKSYEVIEGDVVIIGEPMKIEHNLPIESGDLLASIKEMKESPFRFLILAQLAP